MPDYKKMYAILCGAVDDVIGPLEKFPYAQEYVQRLKDAMLEAEEIYHHISAGSAHRYSHYK